MFPFICVAALMIILSDHVASQSVCRPTPPDLFGPYYRPNPQKLLRQSSIHRIHSLHMFGTVLSDDCMTPLPNMVIEIWQADPRGSYWNAPDLRGYIVTDRTGRYEFTTVYPGSYRERSGFRPAHIHFYIPERNGHVGVVTQMYFAGDPYLGRNDSCGVCNSEQRDLQSVKSKDTCDVCMDRIQFDFILSKGTGLSVLTRDGPRVIRSQPETRRSELNRGEEKRRRLRAAYSRSANVGTDRLRITPEFEARRAISRVRLRREGEEIRHITDRPGNRSEEISRAINRPRYRRENELYRAVDRISYRAFDRYVTDQIYRNRDRLGYGREEEILRVNDRPRYRRAEDIRRPIDRPRYRREEELYRAIDRARYVKEERHRHSDKPLYRRNEETLIAIDRPRYRRVAEIRHRRGYRERSLPRDWHNVLLQRSSRRNIYYIF